MNDQATATRHSVKSDQSSRSSNIDNFSFYQFVSRYKPDGTQSDNTADYGDGPAHYAKFLLRGHDDVAKKIAKAGGFATSCLNVPDGPYGKHTLFLGFSCNFVARVTYADDGFENVENVELIQEDPHPQDWHGGVISLAYVEGSLFAGTGRTTIVSPTEFEWEDFLNSLWEMSPSFTWTHKEDGYGGAVFVHENEQWKRCIPTSGDKGAVNTLRAFQAGGNPYVVSFAADGELPQTVSEGFDIVTDEVGEAPIAYAWPTASKVTVERLHFVQDGVQIGLRDAGGAWAAQNVYLADWKNNTPTDITVGVSEEKALFAVFKTGEVKSLNMNDFKGLSGGWNNLPRLDTGHLTSITLNPYSQSPSLVITAIDGETGHIHFLDLNGKNAAAPVRTKHAPSHVNICQSGDDFYTVYTTRHNGRVFLIKNFSEASWDLLHCENGYWYSPNVGHHVYYTVITAVSNLIRCGDNKLRVYVGYSTGDIVQCTFNPSTNEVETAYIRSYADYASSRTDASAMYVRPHGTATFYNDAPYGKTGSGEQCIMNYAESIKAVADGTTVTMLVQVARLNWQVFGDNSHVKGMGSFTTRFDATMPGSELLDNVYWNTFANNVNEDGPSLGDDYTDDLNPKDHIP